jgi:hypothetical protein
VTAKSKRPESYSGRFSLPIGTERFEPRFVVSTIIVTHARTQ